MCWALYSAGNAVRLKSVNHLSTLLGFASLGGDILKARFIRGLMKDIVSVVALAVATGFTAGALLIGLAYLAYQELVQAGLEPAAALVLILLIGGCLTFFLLRFTQLKLWQLRRARHQHFGYDPAGRIAVLLESFVAGLIQSSRSRR